MKHELSDHDEALETRGSADVGGARSTRLATGSTRQLLCVRRSEGRVIRLANFRRREWGAAIDAAGIAKPARLYDLRSTFASSALAAGITVYELARIMGTSVSMIEAHYGALLDTAHDAILDRLDGVVGSFPDRDDGVAISEGVE